MERTRFNMWHQPGHKITLLSPLTIRNLLPYDVHYQIKCETLLEGLMKPSKSINIPEVCSNFILIIDNKFLLLVSFFLNNLWNVLTYLFSFLKKKTKYIVMNRFHVFFAFMSVQSRISLAKILQIHLFTIYTVQN